MPDIGFGEILVIIVLALLVFGPDRLPKVAADAARTLRQARRMAAAARKDLVDASGIHEDEEFAQTVRDLRDLDPRNVMKEPPPNRRAPGNNRRNTATGSTAAGSGSRSGGAATPGDPKGEPTPPAAAPGAGAAPADPDWT